MQVGSSHLLRAGCGLRRCAGFPYRFISSEVALEYTGVTVR